MTEPATRLDGRIRRRHRRTTLVVALLALAAAVLLGYMWRAFTSRVEGEEQRADRAVTTAVQLCQQVRDLGGVCVADPDELRGDPGKEGAQGPAGPPPSDAQVRTAVQLYFWANPPMPGRPPTASEIAVAVVDYVADHPIPPGSPGERGPGPTAEQVAAAVQEYLAANPPPAGPAPTPEQIAAAVRAYVQDNPLPLCPVGAHVEEYQPPLDTRVLIVCVKDD